MSDIKSVNALTILGKDGKLQSWVKSEDFHKVVEKLQQEIQDLKQMSFNSDKSYARGYMDGIGELNR